MSHIPLRDFFRNPEKTAFKISPNGIYFSYLSSYEGRLNIFIQKVGESTAYRITNDTERDIRQYMWANDDYLVYAQDKKGDENFRLYAIDRAGKQCTDLTPFSEVKAELVDDLPCITNEILIALNKRNKQIFDVYRVNIATGELKMEVENPGNVINWVTDHEGVVRIAITSDGVNQSILHRANESEDFTTVATISFKETFAPRVFTADNKNIYALSNIGRDKAAVVLYDIAKGEEIEELFSCPTVDVLDIGFSDKQKKITGGVYITDKRQIHFFDEKSKQTYQYLEQKLGTDKEIYLVATNRAEDKFLVRTTSDRSLGAYHFYNVTDNTLIKLADLSPWMNESQLCEMKPIVYIARDGLTIHGYLTLPNDVVPKNLPVVINPHGGPWHRDVWMYNPEVQFLANRGYAVLQMNFRGSTGYGRAFWQASFKQWGRTMQDDITDGVQWLIQQGIADPQRIAIYGGSYGGYATLAGVTFTPDLYACGIDYVGVSSLFSFIDTIPPYWKPFLEQMYEMVGHPDRDKEQLQATSPLHHVDKIKAPLFVVQGAKDPRVKQAESDQMVAALRARGVNVQYMLKENEGHGFMNQENKFEFYAAMESFLGKHLQKVDEPAPVLP